MVAERSVNFIKIYC